MDATADRITSLETRWSELAVAPHTKEDVARCNEESEHHLLYRLNTHLVPSEACAAYNIEYMQPYQHVSKLGVAKRIFVAGAGPSLTRARVRTAMSQKWDAILLTPPVVPSFENILEKPGVYIVDGETDKFTGVYCYGPLAEKARLVCPSIKELDIDYKPKETYWYDREIERYPKTSGAVALKMAWGEMQASEVWYSGIDLSEHFANYRNETLPYMRRARVWA